MIKRALLWFGGVGAFQLGALVYLVLFGSFAYQGGSDTSSMRAALQMYAGDLRILFERLWLLDSLVLLLWTLPLGIAYVGFRSRWGRVGWVWMAGAFVIAYVGWVALAALRSPTLLAPVLYGDGSSVTSAGMRLVCSRSGPAWLGLGLLVVVAAIWRLSGPRLAVGAIAFYALVVGVLVGVERYSPRLMLKPGSVVVLLADSLRSDRFTAQHLPAIHPVATRQGAVVVPQVVPPVARTTPAVVSLLTGRLPAETGVTTMFSNEPTFKQAPTVVNAYRNAGYCTVAVGEYPAEMLSKYEFGFETVDVPRVRFKEISLQAVLSNDAFFLASESWVFMRARMGRTMRRLVEGLPTFAAPLQLLRRFEDHVAACGDRPVFALVFADQPHFPYAQSWPYYLEKGAGYAGRFQFGKDDTVSVPKTDAERQHIRDLYDTSLLSTDAAYGRLLAHLEATQQLEHSTVVVSGDHGETLYDQEGVLGHGDRLGSWEGVVVPWVVLGRGRETFASLPGRIQSTRLAPLLAKVNQLVYDVPPALPPDVIYLETDMWLANTGGLPRNRVKYPELSGILTVKDRDADIELDRDFLSTIEFAKHRLWIVDGREWSLEPTATEVIALVDGKRTTQSEFPAVARQYLHRFYPDVAPALLP